MLIFIFFIPSLSYSNLAYLNLDLRGPRAIGCLFDSSPDLLFALVHGSYLIYCGAMIGRECAILIFGSVLHLISKVLLSSFRYFIWYLDGERLPPWTEAYQWLDECSIILIPTLAALSLYHPNSLISDKKCNHSRAQLLSRQETWTNQN